MYYEFQYSVELKLRKFIRIEFYLVGACLAYEIVLNDAKGDMGLPFFRLTFSFFSEARV